MSRHHWIATALLLGLIVAGGSLAAIVSAGGPESQRGKRLAPSDVRRLDTGRRARAAAAPASGLAAFSALQKAPTASNVLAERSRANLSSGSGDSLGVMHRAATIDSTAVYVGWGSANICVAIRPDAGGSVEGCSSLTTASDAKTPLTATSIDGPSTTVVALLPDDVTRATVALSSGESIPLQIENNVGTMTTQEKVRSLSVVGSAGTGQVELRAAYDAPAPPK